MKHLIINLQAPLMAFGGPIIDNQAFTNQFPAASMLTGLMGNALGWSRTEPERLQALQDRLIFAARMDRDPNPSTPLVDFQTAKLGRGVDPFIYDRHWVVGWTTRGEPDVRTGSLQTSDSPHLLYRSYLSDAHVTVALRLDPQDQWPTIDDLANALLEPHRPLFIGRRSCIPTCRIFQEFQEGPTALAALTAQPLWEDHPHPGGVNTHWPDGESIDGLPPHRRFTIVDTRDWVSNIHGGARIVREGRLPKALFTA